MKMAMAIFEKQMKDTWHNKSVLLQFFLVPILALIMGFVAPENYMTKQDIAAIFTTMYVGLIPFSCMCSIVAEDREKGTLRCLRMANLSGGQYLIGIGSCLLVETSLGVVILSFLGGYSGTASAQYIGIAACGSIASLLLGAAIGLLAKNQMSATALSTPIAIFLSIMPTMATMNDQIKQISKLLYTHQINELLQNVGNNSFLVESAIILAVNFFIFAVTFAVIYHKKGLQ